MVAERKLAPTQGQSVRQLQLPGIGWGGLRPDPVLMRRLVAVAVSIDTANEDKPRERVAHVTRGTLQGASNIMLGRTGLHDVTLFSLLCGFPTLQANYLEIIRSYARDPEILQRKVAELEAHWRSLRSADHPDGA
jgi:hypothetical protein